MYKISHEVINLIEKNHENLESGIDSWRKKRYWSKDPKRYFPRRYSIIITIHKCHDELSPILLVIAMMPLNHILRKCKAEYKLSRSQEKINQLMYIFFAKHEKELETLVHAVRKYRQDLLLWFDLRPGQKCHLRWCTGRKWHIPMALRRRNRVGGNWLTKWDELKNPMILS